jgi:hypothetical protein
MNIEIDFTKELTNTHFAPLAILSAHYQGKNLLKPLQQVQIPMRDRYFSPASKLIQVLLSILAGCETLSEVNPTLKQEPNLALVWGLEHFADQSSLSRTLDELTLKNIDELRTGSCEIWKPISQVHARDWRKFLWLDFDLTPLPCGPLAQESQKGYFGEKKRHRTAVGSGQRQQAWHQGAQVARVADGEGQDEGKWEQDAPTDVGRLEVVGFQVLQSDIKHAAQVIHQHCYLLCRLFRPAWLRRSGRSA